MLLMLGKKAITATVSPTSQVLSGLTTARTFSPTTVTVVGGTPSAYVWKHKNQSGLGTWSVNAGQGTATGTSRVTGVTAGDLSTAEFYCTVTVDGTDYDSESAAHSYENLN